MKVISIFSSNRENDLGSILAGCIRKDAQAQRRLFNRCAPRVLTTCRRYETRGLDAKDILQETFIAVFEKITQYDPEKAAVETWINRIAVNTALKMLRKQQPAWIELDRLPEMPSEAEPDADGWQEIDEEQVLKTIQELPLGYRTVFNLYVMDNFSHADIAEKLGISIQTSKSQLFKAKAMLRQTLNAQKKTINCMNF